MRVLCFIVLLILSFFSVKSQNLITESYNNVPRTDREMETNLQDYPYMAVSVLFRGVHLFSDKKFVTRRLKLKYFFAEASVINSGITTSVPLFFLQREKGRFSVRSFQDRTIIRKVPISIYSNSIPTVEINTEIQFKDKAVSIIKAITDKIGPLISSPTKIFGPGSTSMLFGFMDEVIGQLESEIVVNASVGFDVFTPEKLNIFPAEYKVIILKPRDEPRIDLTNYSLLEINGQLVLTDVTSTKFVKYPYFIVEIGLSNYLSFDNIPSQFALSNLVCDVDEENIQRIESTLFSNSDLLTSNQQLAERTLLQYLSILLKIKNGIIEQNKETPLEQVMIDAYNAYYEYKNELNTSSINAQLYSDHYEGLIGKISFCIESQIKLLTYLPILDKVISIYEVTDFSSVPNVELGNLDYFIGQAKQVPYIIKSKFYGGIEFRRRLIEEAIYEKHFRDKVNFIIRATGMNDSVRRVHRELTEFSNQYNNCKKCINEKMVATDKYIELDGEFKQIKNSINGHVIELKYLQNVIERQQKNIKGLQEAINKVSINSNNIDLLDSLNKSLGTVELSITKKSDEINQGLQSLEFLFQKNSYSFIEREEVKKKTKQTEDLKKTIGDIVVEIKLIRMKIIGIKVVTEPLILNFSQ